MARSRAWWRRAAFAATLILAGATASSAMASAGAVYTETNAAAGNAVQKFDRSAELRDKQDKILTRIIRECRHEVGLAMQNKPSAAELELAWVLHGGIFYYGVRKYIYESPVLEDKDRHQKYQ